MLISDFKEFIKNCEDFDVINEKEFETLALVVSKMEQTFCTFLDDEKYIGQLPANATMVFTTRTLEKQVVDNKRGVIITKEPRVDFFNLHNFLEGKEEYCAKKFNSVIGNNCNISSLSHISEHNVIIGDNVEIEPFVTIYSNTKIGDGSIIRSGAKIGGNGFEFKKNINLIPVKHLGGVCIGKEVEIQNNTCIDRAVYPWDETVIQDYTKIDNLVHIGHGAKIGRNVMVVASSGIGGRTTIGDNTWIGFGCIIRNGINIGKNARTNMGAVVTKNVEDSGNVTGNFAINHQDFIRRMKEM